MNTTTVEPFNDIHPQDTQCSRLYRCSYKNENPKFYVEGKNNKSIKYFTITSIIMIILLSEIL